MTYFLSLVFTSGFVWVMYECYQLRKFNSSWKRAYESGLKRGYEIGYAQAKHDERMSR